MCLDPQWLNLQDMDGFQIGCRKCWQCRAKRVNDLIGRGIAESRYHKKTLSLTLTYGGGDTLESSILTYPDVQKFMKRVRKKYGVVRFLCAGEYGSETGRAHWHVILFFENKYPKLVQPNLIKECVLKLNPSGTLLKLTEKMCLDHDFMNKLWPQGYMHVQEAEYASMRYALKYALKEEVEGERVAVRALGFSKQPPLGDKYFRELAIKHVEASLAPQTYEYSFDDFDKSGKRRIYFIQGKSRENYIRYFLEEWAEHKPTQPVPASDIIDGHLDREYRKTEEYIEAKEKAEFEEKKKYSRSAYLPGRVHPYCLDENQKVTWKHGVVIIHDNETYSFYKQTGAAFSQKNSRRIYTWEEFYAAWDNELPLIGPIIGGNWING